ncbi:MAG: TolC family protein, partial [Planctomycetaceae bacterium]|nr:TolC family protein [Planctomycetaceae bacterium]
LVYRTNYSLSPEACPGDLLVPDCVSLEDGVTADEAVMVALWNNPAFQELLAGLELSRAQVFNAGLLPDPVLQVFYPIGPKQLEMTLFQGFTALWLRPVQKRAAERDLDQLANQLVQNGLDVIRDTRLAHADWLMAQQQLEVAIKNRDLRKELYRLAERRQEAGAISELEAVAPLLEELNAESDMARLRGDVEATRARLLFLMGLPETGQPLMPVGEDAYLVEVPPANDLVTEALQSRPDLLAARYAMDAALERIELQKRQFITLDGIADANGRGTKGFEIGPGTRFSIPIFNGNKGNIAIAEAQYQIAARRYFTVENQVRQDVLTAHARLQQASNNLKIVESKILPATRTASELARKNFEGGGASYVLTLQTVGQNLTAQSTRASLIADLNRARAEMERGVGHQIDLPPASEPIPNAIPPASAPEPELDQPQSSLPNLRPCRPVLHRTESY